MLTIKLIENNEWQLKQIIILEISQGFSQKTKLTLWVSFWV